MPEPPPHLTDEAKAEWERVCPELYEAGLLTKIDRAILGAYCSAYGRWEVAELALARYRADGERKGDPYYGLMMRTLRGNAVQNPLVGACNKSMADMARYCSDLGMTPSARSRVVANPPNTESDDPAARYF